MTAEERTLIPYQPGKEEFLAKCREGRVEYFNGTRAEYGFIEGVKIIMSDKNNDPVNFRPNSEDRRIMDKLREYISKLTKQPVFDTAAIRYALRFWEEHKEDE